MTQRRDHRTAFAAVAALGLTLGVVAALLATRGARDEAPPPFVDGPAAPTTSAFVLVGEPAPEPTAPPATDAGAPRGRPADVTGLRACCAALAQNARSMPPPNSAYAAAAASYCSGAVASVNQPGQRDAVFSGVRGLLRGAPAPSACL
ncbi:MAG: hypothetical protein IT374_04035 [Polyangiaceae bacterium]|nr:hypothetical protein [Polyangiaceae bacterium]